METRSYLLVFAALCLLGFTASHAVPLDDTDVSAELDDASSRIINGGIVQGTNSTVYAYQAAVLENMRHVCGGAILNDHLVITAATCVTTTSGSVKSPSNFHVGVGQLNLNNYNETIAYRASTFYVHEDFNRTTLLSNIAVIRVRSYFEFTTLVWPIAMASTVPAAPTTCVASGWGAIWTNPVAPDMHNLYASSVNVTACSGVSPSAPNLTFCASSTGTGICLGDIGGPLRYVNETSTLVGIASHSTCALGGTAVYTRVPSYNAWLQEVVQRAGASATSPGLLALYLVLLALVRQYAS